MEEWTEGRQERTPSSREGRVGKSKRAPQTEGKRYRKRDVDTLRLAHFLVLMGQGGKMGQKGGKSRRNSSSRVQMISPWGGDTEGYGSGRLGLGQEHPAQGCFPRSGQCSRCTSRQCLQGMSWISMGMDIPVGKSQKNNIKTKGMHFQL